jgi:hypothetical protein
MQEEEIQVIEDDAAAAEDAEEGEWESGDETPARHRSVSNPAEAMYRRVSEASTRSAQEQQPQQPQDEPVVSPDAVAAAPTPRDPPATQRTTGFPGARAPLTPASIASVSAGATSQSEHSPAASTVGSAALEVTTKPAATRTRDGFPFPEMPRDREHEDGADGAKETHTDDHASVAAASPQRERRVPSTQTGIQRSRVPSMPAQTLTKQASYTSLRSLRAPHPLNSHDNRTEASKRMSSIHCPPAAPAVVYRESVGGLGWEVAVASPTSATGAPDTPVTPQGCRTERIGSFSSVRSLKGVLSTSSASPRTPTFSSGTGPRHPSRRLTALQAASAAARLNTTSDTVAYHQSLGFSAATAETAHLLSRFLPPKAPHRPGWVITTREAIEAHAAAERGELHEYRLGLTDGQYRDAHESLVHTLKEIKAQQPRGRARSSYYGYGALLGGAANAAAQPFSADAAAVPVGAGDGQTPFELSVARCLTQRPKFVV